MFSEEVTDDFCTLPRHYNVDIGAFEYLSDSPSCDTTVPVGYFCENDFASPFLFGSGQFVIYPELILAGSVSSSGTAFAFFNEISVFDSWEVEFTIVTVCNRPISSFEVIYSKAIYKIYFLRDLPSHLFLMYHTLT